MIARPTERPRYRRRARCAAPSSNPADNSWRARASISSVGALMPPSIASTCASVVTLRARERQPRIARPDVAALDLRRRRARRALALRRCESPLAAHAHAIAAVSRSGKTRSGRRRRRTRRARRVPRLSCASVSAGGTVSGPSASTSSKRLDAFGIERREETRERSAERMAEPVSRAASRNDRASRADRRSSRRSDTRRRAADAMSDRVRADRTRRRNDFPPATARCREAARIVEPAVQREHRRHVAIAPGPRRERAIAEARSNSSAPAIAQAFVAAARGRALCGDARNVPAPDRIRASPGRCAGSDRPARQRGSSPAFNAGMYSKCSPPAVEKALAVRQIAISSSVSRQSTANPGHSTCTCVMPWRGIACST